MKTSNKILLAVSIVPFIIAVIMIFSWKNMLDKEPGTQPGDSARSDYVKKNYDLEGFDEIKADGIWEIHLSAGDRFKVELESFDDSIKHTSVTKSGSTLILSSKKEYFSISDRPRINITMPALSRLNLTGMYDVDISGLNDSKMSVDITGVLSLTGIDSSVGDFSFSGSGIVYADLKDMPVNNANFNFNGVYLINMLMNGGELTGRIKGPGKIITKGNIIKNSINVDAPGNFTQLDVH